MSFLNNALINIYSIAVLMVIYHQANKQVDQKNTQHRLFLRMTELAMILLMVDIASRLDGRPDTVYASINAVGNFVMFLMSPVYPTLWLLYVQQQVEIDHQRKKKTLLGLLSLFITHAVLVLVSLKTGWYYHIDEANIYHRGPFFGIPVLFTVAIIGYSYYLILNHRNFMAKRRYLALICFAIPPLIGIVLQVLFYGATLVLSGVVLSLLIVYFSIQNQRIHTDFLTGVFNRNKLDNYMEKRIKSVDTEGTFSALLIDLDDFKLINDEFGHDVGDEALEIAANLLNSVIGKEDVLSRYGGDEFCILLNHPDEKYLEMVVNRIHTVFDGFNQSGEKPYLLGLSIGRGIFNPMEMQTATDFLRFIDRQMYHEKRLKKSKSLQNQGKRSS